MQLFINNEPEDCSSEITIAQLLEQKEMSHLKGLAVAINDVVVPKAEWETYFLDNQSHVTIIRASQGG